ncbi:MAG: hypothetical protein IJ528_09335 [Bacteroidaceae bacterium]|nr:hypothetical protein [Bacteroidaceae bacterium]
MMAIPSFAYFLPLADAIACTAIHPPTSSLFSLQAAWTDSPSRMDRQSEPHGLTVRAAWTDSPSRMD